jgi:hypothetical protein
LIQNVPKGNLLDKNSSRHITNLYLVWEIKNTDEQTDISSCLHFSLCTNCMWTTDGQMLSGYPFSGYMCWEEVLKPRFWEVGSLYYSPWKHFPHSASDNEVTDIFLLFCTCKFESQDTAVGIATGYWLDDQGAGVQVPVGARIFISPCHPDWLWGPPNLLPNGYQELFPRG